MEACNVEEGNIEVVKHFASHIKGPLTVTVSYFF